MPNVQGVVLTERDRVLLCYVGIARYASAEQVHRLFFDGCSKKQTYRRLAKLCTPGGRPGEGAYLRRLAFRRREGTGVPVWALTPFGRGVAAPLVPWLRPPAASDVGARFLEHTLMLNDVLAGLVLKLRLSVTAPLARLPFRWLSEDDGVLDFRTVGRQALETYNAVLKPDAILEVPGRARRLFIEAETGTQSITTARPGQTGAVVSKLRRYHSFLSSVAGEGRTWYQRAFPDGYEPRLWFLVHSTERRDRVRKAVEHELRTNVRARYQVLAYTFAEAAGVLHPYITHGQLGAEHRDETRLVAVDAQTARRLRDSYNELAEALEKTRAVLTRHNATPGVPQLPVPPVRVEALRSLRDFIQNDVLALPQHQPSRPMAPAGARQDRGAGSHGA